ncbi:predicted protein [Naegleria gruberi]|uniref:Predicted protein n=1 Tax=Naegleria gruberi TaxID=5762 RepID=D2VX06_NAEGR|nr:uncharacterized protein NAEGRDRAFT_81532 [Naegleria gruberi]EFC38785.1 predicted protein [Naegleria gruberi]|eukprot:XP_002671529.1 predicted protein [Naegleria gruberi strain NEG-M]
MSSAAVCGFIDSKNGLLSSFVNRWSWYVNEGVFSTPDHPPQNFGLLLPVMSVLSLIFHSLMYAYGSDWFSKKYSTTFKKKIFGEEKERREWNSRIVSNIHAILSSLISLYCIVFVYLPSPNVGILSLSDRSCIFLIGYCVGYFLYDLYIVARNYPHLGGMETVLHHSISIVALLGSAVWEKCIVLMVIMMFTEISTPFVNQRYFFSKCNMKDSKLYAYNGILMWLTFGIVRISFCFYIPHLVWEDSETWCSFPLGWIILVTLMIGSICILNIFWFYKITMGLVQVVFAKKQPSSVPSTSSTPSTPDRINVKEKKCDEDDDDERELDEKVATTLPLIRR